MNSDGELQFHGPGPGFRARLETAEFDQALEDRVIFWNGSAGHHAAKKPGRVRS
jgi:hypothetical protein